MPRTKSEVKTCPICGEKFFTIGYRDSRRMTCSPKCANIKRSKVTDHKTIIDLYKSGLSAMKIANQYNVADVTILRILHINNIEMRDKNDRSYNQSKKKKKKKQEFQIDINKIRERVRELEAKERQERYSNNR